MRRFALPSCANTTSHRIMLNSHRPTRQNSFVASRRVASCRSCELGLTQRLRRQFNSSKRTEFLQSPVSSGVTRNSGGGAGAGQMSKSSISSPSPILSLLPLLLNPSHFLPLPIHPYTFTSCPSPTPPFPNLSSSSFHPVPLITARWSGEPKICKSVKSFAHVHKTPSWKCCNKTF